MANVSGFANPGFVAHGSEPSRAAATRRQRGMDWSTVPGRYQVPVFGMDVQGSCGGFGSPRCSSSIEMPSGERTNAM